MSLYAYYQHLCFAFICLLVFCFIFCFFFFNRKTAYELRISDWSSDVCSSDLVCVAIEIQRIIFVGARDDVPASPAAAEMVQRGKSTRNKIGLIERGNGGRHETNPTCML